MVLLPAGQLAVFSRRERSAHFWIHTGERATRNNSQLAAARRHLEQAQSSITSSRGAPLSVPSDGVSLYAKAMKHFQKSIGNPQRSGRSLRRGNGSSPKNDMRIGIIGAGKVGGSLGKLWVRAGHKVFFSSRHPNRLNALTEEAGPRGLLRHCCRCCSLRRCDLVVAKFLECRRCAGSCRTT